jgi:diaminohydroxyphosphoribosylaminopyrimidine deaminase/5-amino-6-(5-phosphoribosylamino)uracil reductase
LASAGIKVEVGLGGEEAQRAHAGHLRRVRDGRPHVTLKLGVSRDGKAGFAGRRPAAITGERARERVHLMRAKNDAVITGIGTVLSDNPQLNCRLPGMSDRSPVRVVLDRILRMVPDSLLATSARETPVWVLTGEAAPESNEQALSALGMSVIRIGTRDGALDLSAALKALADRGMTRVMVEAGPILSAAFLRADLVDAAALFRAPRDIGDDGIDALEGMKLDALTQSPGLALMAIEAVGDDTVEAFERR